MPAGGNVYRILVGQWVGIKGTVQMPTALGAILVGRVELEYDDQTTDFLTLPPTALVAGTGISAVFDHPASKNGWIVGVNLYPSSASATPPQNSAYVVVYLIGDQGFATRYDVIAQGMLGGYQGLMLGIETDRDGWAMWAFQGTVQEDTTVGTHVCTLTVVPGAGFEMEFLYGQIIATGAAGLAQSAYITDPSGSYVLATFFSATAAGTYNFPYTSTSGAASGPTTYRVSGLCHLVLSASTSTVSDTQTFSVVCKIRKNLPGATLADNTGTPTLTTNISGVY